MSFPAIESAYGPWLISLFLETVLYGIGVAQTILYFHQCQDKNSIRLPVIIVMVLETLQLALFFRSTYFRFVQKFGIPQDNLIWSDSLQLLANYLSAFTVQIYFASRVHRLTRGMVMLFRLPPAFGIYIAGFLAILQISAGIAQAVLSYGLHSYSKLDQTASTHFLAITILQTAGSFACDMVITVYLCYFLARNKNDMSRSNTMLNTLMVNAINRGMLTALSSGLTLGLFLGYRETFWFLLSLAPNSKLYMNSMLAMLNMCQHVRDKIDQGWDIVDLNDAHSATNASS